jgi:hypothetical protein
VEEFRHRQCGWCRSLFAICRRCDRGQAYCGEACRGAGYRRCQRSANRCHQQSDEGRLDHCDRQRAYRARQRARVTDKGSPPCPIEGMVPRAAATEPPQEVNDANQRFEKAVRCVRCGRRGRYFRWHPARSRAGWRGAGVRPGIAGREPSQQRPQ